MSSGLSAASVYIIIPVHNRKEVTLRCLAHLYAQSDVDACSVIVVDDGSTDGTSQAISVQYPQVHLLKGDGNLWWTGSIRVGMEYAYAHHADYIVWLNDDTVPLPATLQTLVDFCSLHPNTIASAQCYETSKFKVPTYGGHRCKHLKHFHVYAPSETTVDCESLSGNLVCFPQSVIKRIGFPSNELTPHYFGDVIYTLRAKKSGYRLVLVGAAPAVCAFNTENSSWLTSNISSKQRIRNLRRPKSLFYPKAYWHFCFTIWGVFGVIVFTTTYLRLCAILILRSLLSKQLLTHLIDRTRSA